MHPLFKYKCWSWAWDIIPDQNWIQGWRNGVFWTLPQPRELRTLSQGKLKQSGIKCKNISSNEVLIMNIAVSLHQIVRVRPTSWLQLWQTHWKKKKASWAGSLWPCYIVTMLHVFYALVVACFVLVCWAGYLCLCCMCSMSFIHYFVCFVFLYLSVHVTYGFYARCLQLIKFSVTPSW